MVEYTHNSTAIEGNTLTLRETELALQGITIDKKPLKDHLEVTNHKEAYNYILELVKEKVKLSEKIIKEIHSIVLNNQINDRGIYRTVPVRILGAIHIPPAPFKIEGLMDELIKNYNTNNDYAIKKIATFHLNFEHIHPFIDGNGRTGRLLANLELMKAGYPPIDIKFTDRKEYYDAFENYSLTQSSEKMEFLFANYVLEEIERYLSIIN